MKKLLENKEFQLDEILFENRNKSYGAFAIRSDADFILTKAMFLGIGIFAMVAVTPLVINAFHTTQPTEAPGPPPVFDLTPVDPVEIPPVAQVIPPSKPLINSVDSRTVTPTRDPKVQTVMPKQSEYKDAVLGTEKVTGEPPVINYQPPVIHTVPGNGSELSTPKPVDNSPKTKVDVEASFMGGIDAFRNKVISNFDTSVMGGTNEVVKTTIVFIVERDGTISDVKASGINGDFNRAAEKTIKSIRGKWIPAKVNGENVRSYFKFPISMQFE